MRGGEGIIGTEIGKSEVAPIVVHVVVEADARISARKRAIGSLQNLCTVPVNGDGAAFDGRLDDIPVCTGDITVATRIHVRKTVQRPVPTNDLHVGIGARNRAVDLISCDGVRCDGGAESQFNFVTAVWLTRIDLYRSLGLLVRAPCTGKNSSGIGIGRR